MVGTFTTRRYERALTRLERRITKARARLALLQRQKDEKRISTTRYHRKKSALDDRLRTLSARERTLRGALKQERDRIVRPGATPVR